MTEAPTGITCVECGQTPTLSLSSAFIYGGKDYGPVWHCCKGKSYVGCHPNTTKPLGRPAGPATRYARKMAHAAFDPIWKWSDTGERKSRGGAYAWLRETLNLSPAETHMGMMSEEMALRVVEACIERRRAIRRQEEEIKKALS